MNCCAVLLIVALAFAATRVVAGDIRGVDFKNFVYSPACLIAADGETQTVRVVNGSFCGHTKGGTTTEDFLDFTVEQIVFGDLTGDGHEEAVVVTRCNTGGTGVYSEALVFQYQHGNVRLLCRLPGGDRALGGIHSTTVERGLLRLEVFGTNAGACCPKWIEVRNYLLKAGQLEFVGCVTPRK